MLTLCHQASGTIWLLGLKSEHNLGRAFLLHLGILTFSGFHIWGPSLKKGLCFPYLAVPSALHTACPWLHLQGVFKMKERLRPCLDSSVLSTLWVLTRHSRWGFFAVATHHSTVLATTVSSSLYTPNAKSSVLCFRCQELNLAQHYNNLGYGCVFRWFLPCGKGIMHHRFAYRNCILLHTEAIQTDNIWVLAALLLLSPL